MHRDSVCAVCGRILPGIVERALCRRYGRTVVALVVAAALVLATGCSRAPSGPAVDTVKRYLTELPAALHGDSLEGIRPMATADQLDRVRLYVAYVLNEGERMESALERLAILSADIEGGRATVESDERWSVVYRDSKDGRTTRSEKYRLRVRYSLLLQEGSWRIHDVEEIERTAL